MKEIAGLGSGSGGGSVMKSYTDHGPGSGWPTGASHRSVNSCLTACHGAQRQGTAVQGLFYRVERPISMQCFVFARPHT